MFFTCPKCNTVYDVPPEQIDDAEVLHCAVCGYLWDVSAETEGVEPEEEENKIETKPAIAFDDEEREGIPVFPDDIGPDPFANESDLRAFKPIFQIPEEPPAEKSWIRPLYFFSMVCIAVAIYAFFFHTPAKVPLEIQSLSPEFVEKDYQTNLILNTVVKNKSERDLSVKTFRMYYYDKSGNEVTQSDFPVERTFKANAATPVKLEVGRPPAQAERATLEIEKP